MSNSGATRKNPLDDSQASIPTHPVHDLNEPAVASSEDDEVDRCCGCQCPTILLIILCFFLPPLAVGIHVGFCRPPWIINFILFFLGFIPAVIHGILTVRDHTPYTMQRKRERERRRAERAAAQDSSGRRGETAV